MLDMCVPDVTFYMRERDDTIAGPNPFKWVYKTSKDLFANKRVLIIGLPGAFTPTCSNHQLPDFDELYEDFRDQGIDEIWCTSVNDAFVMHQWSQHLDVTNIKMLPDGNGDFAEGMGMLVDKRNLGFGKRSWRYVALVDDLVVTDMWDEYGIMNNCPTDPYEYSAPDHVLKNLG